jgi:hypothetical protein
MKIILPSGEKFQELCGVYIGEQGDFEYNSKILKQTNKQLFIDKIPDNYNNPRLVFCYTHLVEKLYHNLSKFQNNFVLITHNSDYNITKKHLYILDSTKIIHWFSQNVTITHPKLSFIPIGIANSCWGHGNEINFYNALPESTNKNFIIYFNFTVNTNPTKRQTCKDTLENIGLKFMDSYPSNEYLAILAQHKYSICPEGNGIDSHRIWESYILKTIPIMLKNSFTEIVAKDYPCILLDNWNDLTLDLISDFENNNINYLELEKKIDFNYFKDKILQHI